MGVHRQHVERPTHETEARGRASAAHRDGRRTEESGDDVTEAQATTTTIEQVVRIAATPKMVWAFWTEPERLAEWWGIEAVAVAEPGGMFRVVMEGGPVMLGAFTELDPPRRLVFTFGWEQNAPGEPLAPGSTRVEVTLTPEGDDTILVLRHFEMPSTHAADHESGWSYYLGDRLATLTARP
ncbi:MAG: SRPBCC domain-containing protein [Acidimicrobiia bacterium]